MYAWEVALPPQGTRQDASFRQDKGPPMKRVIMAGEPLAYGLSMVFPIAFPTHPSFLSRFEGPPKMRHALICADTDLEFFS